MAPQNAFALCQRALTLGFLQRFEEAARDISASTRFDPTNKCLLSIQQISKENKEGAP
jgi:hypothetical protein